MSSPPQDRGRAADHGSGDRPGEGDQARANPGAEGRPLPEGGCSPAADRTGADAPPKRDRSGRVKRSFTSEPPEEARATKVPCLAPSAAGSGGAGGGPAVPGGRPPHCTISRPAAAPHVVRTNKWESAEFGSSDEKQKFMRLMGGLKKKDTAPAKASGSVVFEDPEAPAGRTKAQTEVMQSHLEQQYETGRMHMMHRRQGLGYQ